MVIGGSPGISTTCAIRPAVAARAILRQRWRRRSRDTVTDLDRVIENWNCLTAGRVPAYLPYWRAVVPVGLVGDLNPRQQGAACGVDIRPATLDTREPGAVDIAWIGRW